MQLLAVAALAAATATAAFRGPPPLRRRHSLHRLASTPTRTERILRKLDGNSADSGGAGTSSTWDNLVRADAQWAALRGAGPAPFPPPSTPFVAETGAALGRPADYDVLVAGGTLGIFVAGALQRRGHKVAVVERNALAGRDQEWNLSRKELAELVAEGVLTAEECESAIRSEFNPMRCGFGDGDKRYDL